MLIIRWISHVCRRSSAAMTPVKYETDSSSLTGIFLRNSFFFLCKKINGALVTRTPKSLSGNSITFHWNWWYADCSYCYIRYQYSRSRMDSSTDGVRVVNISKGTVRVCFFIIENVICNTSLYWQCSLIIDNIHVNVYIYVCVSHDVKGYKLITDCYRKEMFGTCFASFYTPALHLRMCSDVYWSSIKEAETDIFSKATTQ